MEFGELIDVDLREAWPHEANDFTPWLAENLHRLSQAIGGSNFRDLGGYRMREGRKSTLWRAAHDHDCHGKGNILGCLGDLGK